MEEKAVREFRVWLETGDLLGCASIYKRRAWWTVELTPFLTSEKVRTKGFRSESEADSFAQEAAERYMAEAVEWEKNHCAENGCEDDHDYADSYSIQIVEGD
jgi:hypothetical protein